MQLDSDARSRYLALALDTRAVIDGLVDFIDQGTRKVGFEDALTEVLDSVKSTISSEGPFSKLRHRQLAEYYEQVQTWEVLTATDREKIVEKLLSLVSADSVDVETQKRDAFEVLELLARVESRALYNYRPQSA